MKTRYIPAIVMLCAGFIFCVCSIHKSESLLAFTEGLLLVLVIFLVIGSIVKVILDKAMKAMEDKKAEDDVKAQPEDEAQNMENIGSSDEN